MCDFVDAACKRALPTDGHQSVSHPLPLGLVGGLFLPLGIRVRNSGGTISDSASEHTPCGGAIELGVAPNYGQKGLAAGAWDEVNISVAS